MVANISARSSTFDSVVAGNPDEIRVLIVRVREGTVNDSSFAKFSLVVVDFFCVVVLVVVRRSP